MTMIVTLFPEMKFEHDPQALRSIINSEGMTPLRVAAPKRQTTTGAIIRQVNTVVQ